MNRNDFLQMMENPVGPDRRLTGEINEVIDIFPWFQSAHLLLLRSLHNSGDVTFGKQLRTSALHIADREILYNVLQSAPEEDREEKGNPDMVIKDEAAESIPQEQKGEESAPVLKEQRAQLSTAGESVITLGDNIHVEETGESHDQGADVVVNDTADKEQTVIDSAKNSDDLIREIEKDLPETEDEQDIDDPVEDSGSMILISDEISAEEESLREREKSQSAFSSDSLLELDQEASVSEVAKEAPSAQDARSLQSELIDRFIIANPRIEPMRDKKDEPIEDRTISMYEEETFVTETLAKIYISQGYYSRAIDIFEKLSLKFPEKSSYFATQIEKVKEYLKK